MENIAFMAEQIIKEEYKYSELTSRIIKCVYAVHSVLGNGFQEVIYQRAMQIEMNIENLNFGGKLKCRFFTAISKLVQEEWIFS